MVYRFQLICSLFSIRKTDRFLVIQDHPCFAPMLAFGLFSMIDKASGFEQGISVPFEAA